MTPRPRLLALGAAIAASAAGVAVAKDADCRAPAAAPAPRAAPARPAPSARPAPGAYGGYRAYERAYPGGVPAQRAAAPQPGGARAFGPGPSDGPARASRPNFGGGYNGRPFDGERAGGGARFDRDRQIPAARGGDDDRGRGFDRSGGYAPGRAPTAPGFVRPPHALYGGGEPVRGGAGRGSGGGQWRYQGRSYARFRAAPFRYPRGFAYRAWRRGERFPSVFLYGGYWLNDYADFYLAPPPSPQYRWVRYGPDAVLVDVDTGDVADVAYGVFDDGSAPAADPQWDGRSYEDGAYGDAPDGAYGGAAQGYGDDRDGAARPDGYDGYDDRDRGDAGPNGYGDAYGDESPDGPPPPR